jgi:hypothetical protein
MHVERSDLEQRFREFSDTELIGRVQSGTLTEVATEVAMAELKARGLPDPSVVTSNEPTEDASHEDLVEVARLLTPTEASILNARLLAEGIPAHVADAHLGQANSFLSVASGGVRVLVPVSYVAAAREIRAAVARGDYALNENDVLE